MLKNAGTPSNTRSRTISRRSLLQGVGVSLSLPLLNIMVPAAA